MSLATWKAVFYRKPASETTPDEAVAHSLEKWRGLTPEHLSAHDVRRVAFGSIEDVYERFSINTETCALCAHYWEDDEEEEEGHTCGACPLAAVRDGVSCDSEREGERTSPYQIWVDSGDPSPMILWLEKAAKYEGREP